MWNKILLFSFLLLAVSEGPVLAHECMSEQPLDARSGCCGRDATIQPLIIGGTPASLRQYPWLALLEYKFKSNGSYAGEFCGGSLISSRYVLTAAHCINVPDDLNFVVSAVRLGEYDRSNSGRDCVRGQGCTKAVQIPIDEITVHENYFQFINDIALIKLKTLAPYTAHIRPICLPMTDVTTEYHYKLSFHVAGWGTIKQELMPNGVHINHEAAVKKHAQLPYWNLQLCRVHFPLADDSNICAGGKGRDSCMGDSGGPLMYNRNGVHELVGVVSYGSKRCASRNVPGVYAKVFFYKPWILDNIGQ